jgi:hypothetical protein
MGVPRPPTGANVRAVWRFVARCCLRCWLSDGVGVTYGTGFVLVPPPTVGEPCDG